MSSLFKIVVNPLKDKLRGDDVFFKKIDPIFYRITLKWKKIMDTYMHHTAENEIIRVQFKIPKTFFLLF